MKSCTKCGFMNNDSDNFCKHCGQDLNEFKNSLKQQKENFNQQEACINQAPESSVYAQQQNTNANIDAIKQKPKKKSKKIIIIAVVVVLVLCITAGIVLVPRMFLDSTPKVVQVRKDYALFDITFDQFKNGIIKNADVIGEKLFEGTTLENITTQNIEELNNEDNWTSWTNADGNFVHNWKYKYPDTDSMSVNMYVLVDKSSNKVRGVTVTSYYGDISLKTVVMSYVLFGNNLNDENLEIIANLAKYCRDAYEKKPLLFICDIGMTMTKAESYNYDIEYTILPLSENLKEEASSSGVWLEKDNLYEFNKILSARYDYDYEWNTIDEFKQSIK